MFYNQELVIKIQEICSRDIQCFEGQQIEKNAKIPKMLKKHFEKVAVKGDGNGFWHAVSISLFGDDGASEALRLLAADILLAYEDEFRDCIKKHEKKFDDKLNETHETSFEEVLATSTELGAWHDEYHQMALSMAIRRPINCYGDFNQFDGISMSVDKKGTKYDMAKRVYKRHDLNGHYRCVGFEEDDDEEPVCIYFDGQFHYSVLLPRDPKKQVMSLKPKKLLQGYIVPRTPKEPDAEERTKSISKQKMTRPENAKSNPKETSKPNFKKSSKTLVKHEICSVRNIRGRNWPQDMEKNTERVGRLKQKFVSGSSPEASGYSPFSKEQPHRCSSVAKMCEFCRSTTDLVPLDCFHGFCSQCFTTYLEKMSTLSKEKRGNSVLCPYMGCKMTVSTELIRNFFPEFAIMVTGALSKK